MDLKQKWDLDPFYKGGSHSKCLAEAFKQVDLEIKNLDRIIKGKVDLKNALKVIQEISLTLREMTPFIECLSAQDITDSKAHLLQDQITHSKAQFSNISICLDEWLVSLDEKVFQSLLKEPEIKPIAFAVKEKRHRAQDSLSSEKESFINDLAIDSPQMGSFSRQVLHGEWIDAENRSKKRPGGFCVGMPITKQSRIFMTYANTMTNLFTLAHELGHAFHNSVIFSLPEMSQHIQMNVAETASTMAEVIITRASIEEAPTEKEKLFLLDDHLSRSVAYVMNVYARFLFETYFYAERENGYVAPETLNNLMKKAQKEAYGNALGSYHPLFWAAKMHFFFTDGAFYNFPYTFGYLFSLGIHKLSGKQRNFEEVFVALLKDTGQMNVEDLSQKHLSADLTKPDFWELGLKTIDQDIKTYLHLAKKIEKGNG